MTTVAMKIAGDAPGTTGRFEALAWILQMGRQSGEDLWVAAIRVAQRDDIPFDMMLRALDLVGGGKGPCVLFCMRAAYLLRMESLPLPPHLAPLEEAEAELGIREAIANRDLRGMDFSGVQMGWNREDRRRYWWEPTDFSGWDLRGTSFKGAALMRTRFVKADLRGADLSGATFGEWSGDGSDQTTFQEADLRGANLDQTTGATSFSKADCRRATFRKSALGSSGKTTFADAELQESNFKGANINRLDFEGANLSQACLDDVEGTAKFDRAICRGATFRRALLGASEDSTRKQSSFRSAIMNGAVFDGASLRICLFAGTDLGDTSFKRCDLTHSVFRNANAIQADFRMATLVNMAVHDTGILGSRVGRDDWGIFWRGALFHGAILGDASPFSFMVLCRFVEGLYWTEKARWPWVAHLWRITSHFRGLWTVEFQTESMTETEEAVSA